MQEVISLCTYNRALRAGYCIVGIRHNTLSSWRLNDLCCSKRDNDAAAMAAEKIGNAFEWR